ncbi:MAG: hypothetical protein ACFE89_10020 [Candidatus Hodarchaeota archaeon]
MVPARTFKWVRFTSQRGVVSAIRPPSEPGSYPDEPNGANTSRHPSEDLGRSWHRYRLLIFTAILLLVIAGWLGILSTSWGSSHPLYALITFGSLISLVSAVTLLLVLLLNSAFGVLYTEIRSHSRRREANAERGTASRRQRRRQEGAHLRRRARAEDRIQEEESVDISRYPTAEQYDALPAWLLPLLKNRPASQTLHDEISATTTTTEETETKIQSAIDYLETEVTTITIAPDEVESLLISSREKGDLSDEVYRVEYLSEALIERDAVLDLLGALELQHKDGRVTEGFYKRKRKQLLDRLAKLDRTR